MQQGIDVWLHWEEYTYIINAVKIHMFLVIIEVIATASDYVMYGIYVIKFDFVE